MLMLLFSVVLFTGSLFWFTLFRPFNNGNEKTMTPISIKNQEIVLEQPEYDEDISIEIAIKDLESMGCKIICISAKAYIDNPTYVSYKEFRLRAIECQYVIINPDNSGTILLVQNKNKQWVWIPS